MTKLRWEMAYSIEKKDYITVEEALKVRDRHAGEYRENPCYNSKEDFEEGMGIRLAPVNMRGMKVNFFRSFPGQLEARRSIAKSVGMGTISLAKYTDSAVRVKSIINFMLADLPDDEIVIDGMLMLSSRSSGYINSLLHPDIVMYHRGDYSRRMTNVFVKDIGRAPGFEASADDWILDITKFAPDIVTSWKKFRPLFMEEWLAHQKKRDRRVASELDAFENDEAMRALDEIFRLLGDPNREEVESEVDRLLENGEISSLSVANKVQRLYARRTKPSTFVDGNGIERKWEDGSEIFDVPWRDEDE